MKLGGCIAEYIICCISYVVLLVSRFLNMLPNKSLILITKRYNRGANKDKQKEEALKQKFHNLESTLKGQQLEIEQLKKILNAQPPQASAISIDPQSSQGTTATKA